MAVGLGLAVAAVIVLPGWLADRYLPKGADRYRDDIVAGLWCLKFALGFCGCLLLLFPFLYRLWGGTRETGSLLPVLRMEVSPLSRRDAVAAVLLVAFALALRLVGSGQSLISDEISIQQMFISRGIAVIVSYMPVMPQHVLYSLMAWFAQRLPVPIEVAYRLPAILAGAFAVPLFYLLCRRVLGVLASSVAGLLCASSIYAIAHAQMAKSYTWTHLVVLGWSLLILELFRRPNRLPAWIGMGLCYVVLPFLHLYNMHLVLVLGVTHVALLAWLAATPGAFIANVRRLMVLGLFCGGLLFLLYAIQLPQIVKLAREAATQPEEHLSIDFFRGWLMQATFWGRAWPCALVCLALAIVGGIALAAREGRFFLLVLLPVVGVVLLVAVRDAFIYPRYMVYALPVFVLFLVEGARFLGQRLAGGRGARIAVVGVGLLFLVPGTRVLLEYYRTGHQDIRGACAVAAAQARAADAVVSYGLGREDFEFYLPGVKVLESHTALQALVLKSTGRHDVYLLHSYPRIMKHRQDEWRYIEKHFEVIHESDGMLMDSAYRDGGVRVLRARKPADGRR